MICYTVITNNYDTLKEPRIISEGWQYFAFVDLPTKFRIDWDQSIWQPIVIEEDQKKQKIMPEFKSGVTVYVDGSIEINIDLNKLMNNVAADLTFIDHPDRNTLHEEAEAVKRLKKALPVEVDKQIQAYKNNGFDLKKKGLPACGVIIRKHTPTINTFCAEWYKQVELHTKRDQLSLQFTAWCCGITYQLLPSHFLHREFKLFKHKSRKN